MKQIAAPFLMFFLLIGIVRSNPTSTLSPQQILEQMAAAYASCNSYVDEGQVRIVFHTERGDHTEVKPFSTAFVRSSEFRYEFKDRRGEEEWNRYIVWQNGDSVKSWWSLKPEVKTEANLRMALAGPAGISGGSAYTVPMMLMPELAGGRRFTMLAELTLIGEETLDGGRSAYKIEGTDRLKNPVTVWIDKERMLILKIYERRTIDPDKIRALDPKIEVTRSPKKFETETTTTYTSQINVAIAPDKLAFNAPEKP